MPFAAARVDSVFCTKSGRAEVRKVILRLSQARSSVCPGVSLKSIFHTLMQ